MAGKRSVWLCKVRQRRPNYLRFVVSAHCQSGSGFLSVCTSMPEDCRLVEPIFRKFPTESTRISHQSTQSCKHKHSDQSEGCSGRKSRPAPPTRFFPTELTYQRDNAIDRSAHILARNRILERSTLRRLCDDGIVYLQPAPPASERTLVSRHAPTWMFSFQTRNCLWIFDSLFSRDLPALTPFRRCASAFAQLHCRNDVTPVCSLSRSHSFRRSSVHVGVESENFSFQKGRDNGLRSAIYRNVRTLPVTRAII